jgi:trehalose 6-phosphate synthase
MTSPPALDPAAALFIDIDGTLLEIAARPELVRVPPELPALLDRLAAPRGGALAVVSGRRLADVDRLLFPWRGAVAGVHGAECRRGDGSALADHDPSEVVAAAQALDRLRPQLRALTEGEPGVWLEDKGEAVALHYRAVPEKGEEVRALASQLLPQEGDRLRLIYGKMVVELRPRHHSKGTAIAAFLAEPPFRGRLPVFLGDDATDEDGFIEVNRRDGLSIRVGPPIAATAARYALPSVAAARAWLEGQRPRNRAAAGTGGARSCSQPSVDQRERTMAHDAAVSTLARPHAPRAAAPQPRAAAAGGRRLVVVSNRVGPIAGGKASHGGLAVAVRAALEEEGGGLWFGFSGSVSERPDTAPQLETAGAVTAATLDLTRRDFDEYYIGYANRVLWPLFHYRPSLIGFSRQNLDGYLRVNEAFARALLSMLQPNDLIWVHDYHLIPFAAALRRLGWRQPIGFFLHTPFPAAEFMRLLPNHRELMAALCAYDLVGFQTPSDLQGFTDYVLRSGGVALRGGAIQAFGRTFRAAVFPVGVEVEIIAEQAERAEKSRHTRRLRESIRDRALIIGVDRLDYSKGLPARFAAYAHLLEHYHQTRGRVTFLQIAPPSRSEVPEYREIRRTLEGAAGNINGRHAEFDWTPLRYLNKSFPHHVLTGFYRAARLALVTPFRDGMNLVVKEYVASQSPQDPGVPVLSCFAGAAHELGEALIVNPYDRDSVAEAILQGLEMPLGERLERWSAMMATLGRNNSQAWHSRFIAALAACQPAG